MSDTPRTEKAAVLVNGMARAYLCEETWKEAVNADFARQLERDLSAQAARADALEALNATMHERISGLVAEIAQEREHSAKLLEALDSVDELVECERRMARSDNAPLEYEKRSALIYEAMRAATKRNPAT